METIGTDYNEQRKYKSSSFKAAQRNKKNLNRRGGREAGVSAPPPCTQLRARLVFASDRQKYAKIYAFSAGYGHSEA